MRALGEAPGVATGQYRRGAVMGMTMAEAFVLIAFALLLLLGLWKVQGDAERARYEPVAALSPRELEAAARLARSGRLEALDALVAATPPAAREAPGAAGSPEEAWRLIDDDELVRVIDGLEAMPEDLRRDLADLVEIADARGLARLIALSARATGDAPEGDPAAPEARLAVIGTRLDAAQAARRALVADLGATLGATVSGVGGTIEADGSIVLPDTVLFERGSARVSPVMEGFLDRACEPWLRVLQASGAGVAQAQIEGHASSEWRLRTSPDEAYLNNLALSQARSQAVLNACLERVGDRSLRDWAQAHLAAVGYSSARPVLAGGAEDSERSRRVVFSVGFDDARLLRDVEGDVADGLDGR